MYQTTKGSWACVQSWTLHSSNSCLIPTSALPVWVFAVCRTSTQIILAAMFYLQFKAPDYVLVQFTLSPEGQDFQVGALHLLVEHCHDVLKHMQLIFQLRNHLLPHQLLQHRLISRNRRPREAIHFWIPAEFQPCWLRDAFSCSPEAQLWLWGEALCSSGSRAQGSLQLPHVLQQQQHVCPHRGFFMLLYLLFASLQETKLSMHPPWPPQLAWGQTQRSLSSLGDGEAARCRCSSITWLRGADSVLRDTSPKGMSKAGWNIPVSLTLNAQPTSEKQQPSLLAEDGEWLCWKKKNQNAEEIIKTNWREFFYFPTNT